ncbi:MAG TPA: hypothetical protein PKE12_13630 [Kiritimatiellia bacterium]|nr:hypothetical protein [Kiritimatiellia bacterium]
MTRMFRVGWMACGLAALLCASVSRADVAVIRVSGKPQQAMTYGMDFERLWHMKDGEAEVDYDALAAWAVDRCKVDYVRIAINPGAELEEGNIRWGEYDMQLRMMRAIQRARPDIKWFASPRPVHNEQKGAPFTPFPLWISVWENPLLEDAEQPRAFLRFEWEKAADYYLRYLAFMKEQGFKITYLDAINEATRHLDPVSVGRMIGRMREALGSEMPLVIAPSAHNWGEAVRWINAAKEAGVADFWDITACHNTRATGSMEAFVALARTLNRPIWNTELHGFQGPDPAASRNSKVLFEHIRAGFGGINDWLSLGNEAKEHKMLRNVGGEVVPMRSYFIFQHLVNTSGGGHYLEATVPEALATTAAFYHRGRGLVTVWALNASEAPVDAVVQIAGVQCHPIEVRHWGTTNEREGAVVTEGLDGDSSIRHTLEPGALYCFTFEQHN